MEDEEIKGEDNMKRKESQPEFNGLKFAFWTALVIFLIVLLFGCFYIVGAGERGVLLTLGKADMTAKEPGLHFKIPFIQSVVKMNVQTQKDVVEKASAASKDLQTVTTDVTINYYISPSSVAEIYVNIGSDYQNKVISPAILEVVKASTAQYTAEELITKRPEVKDLIDRALTERLATWNIKVQAVSITNFDFSEQFNTAIESKVTAEQNALAAKNKLAQVEYEAEQRVTQAKGEAEAIKIQVEAIKQTGGEQYVQLQYINKWNGQMPQVMSSSALPILNFGGNKTW